MPSKRNITAVSNSLESPPGNPIIATATAQETSSKRNRGAKFSSTEVDTLLDLVEANLPAGADEWDGKNHENIFRVKALYNQYKIFIYMNYYYKIFV
jgi:hypothetical protein